MQAGFCYLKDILNQNNHVFIIPVYQRDYSWNRDQIKQFFEDLDNIAETDEAHFLGTVIYKKKSGRGSLSEFIVIDGQQRITSTVLFARALYDIVSDITNSDKRGKILKEIEERYFFNNGRNIAYRYRLKLSEYDRGIFERLLETETFKEDDLDQKEKQSKIYQSFQFFKEMINAKIDRDICNCFEKAVAYAERLLDATYNLQIVDINLDNENPQIIFESLNSTGLNLNTTDLIRNYLLMPLDYKEQERLYKTYWLNIEKLVGQNMDQFIFDYLIVKRRSNATMRNGRKSVISLKYIYGQLKDYYRKEFQNEKSSSEAAETLLIDLLKYAKLRSHSIFAEDIDYNKLNSLDKKIYEYTVFIQGVKNAHIFIMYLYERYERKLFTENTFVSFLNALISLAFRAIVCGNKRAVFSAQFAGNCLARLEDNEICEGNKEKFWDIVTFGEGGSSFPRDKEFKDKLVTDKLYLSLHSKGLIYLLSALERESPAKKEVRYNDNCSIEHIMPQNLNNWLKYLNEKGEHISENDAILHTLGNLALTSYNSECSNSEFADKKKIYENSNYYYTRQVAKYRDWTSRQIRERGEKLANEALKIWHLPGKYNDRNGDEDKDIFYLKEIDVNIVKGYKLCDVYIGNTKYSNLSWIDFLLHIISYYFDIDKDALLEAGNKNIPKSIKLFAENQDGLRRVKKLPNGRYLDANVDVKTLISTAKQLACNFDSICEENYIDDIYFTLKDN